MKELFKKLWHYYNNHWLSTCFMIGVIAYIIGVLIYLVIDKNILWALNDAGVVGAVAFFVPFVSAIIYVWGRQIWWLITGTGDYDKNK